jgi:hypothetical protein
MTFLQTLFSFHPTKKVATPASIVIAITHGQPTFVVNNDPISIKKCLIGLQAEYLRECDSYASRFFNNTQVSSIAVLLTRIAKKFPFSLPEIF